ncbi:MAG TPA: hypothetical protein DHU33_02820 [Firmicutes bacterium]|nr:hypothetical protein [Bacillota bacterium]
MKSDNFYEMKRCKMDWLDDIFWGTKDSQGIRNATSAIKFVLFDDESQIPDGFTVGDKYEFISSRRDGRAKAKMLQSIDLVQILCKYAMQSFGIKNKNFDIDYDEYVKIRNKKVIKSDFNDDYITELVAYALMDSVYGGYIFVSSNKYIRNSLINALINERYIEEKWQTLDEFNGILKNPSIDEITKKNYLDSYQRMDDDFLNIKRRDNDYLNYLRDTI